MTFLFILLIAPQYLFPALAPLRIALLAAAVSIGAYALDRLMNGRPAGRSVPQVWIAAGILGWAVVTMPMSYWPGGSLAMILDKYAKTLAVFWLLSRVVNTRPRLDRLIWGLTLMGLPLALTALVNFVSGEFAPAGGGYGVKRIMGYESGLTMNPNNLALMLNLILPFGGALLLRARGSWLRAALLAACLLYAAGVIVTFSRAGFLTLAGTLVYYVAKLLGRGRWMPAAAALLLALATVVVLPRSYVLRLATIADIDADPTGSAQARSQDTLTAVRIVLDNPLVGAGAGMSMLALNEARGASWVAAHNVYLEYAVDLGLPALVLFLVLLGACLRDARMVQRRRSERGEEDGLFCIAEGVEAALLAFAVAALFYPAAYDFFFYLIAGIAVSVRTVHEIEQRALAPAPPRALDGGAPELAVAGWAAGAVGE